MNENILNTDVQNFIHENLNTDVVSLLLKSPFFDGISNQELAKQIEARKKSEKKLPTWFSNFDIYYPDPLNIEQTSSEITAAYKSEIISGNSVVDITGGFGVDSYYFSKKCEHVFHCEINRDLSEIASHNLRNLGAANIKTEAQDGMEFLRNSETNFDWIYVDPSRRNENKAKVFQLSDCQPDLTTELKLLFQKSVNILVKTSPLLDFSIGISELRNAKEIHVVAVDNDVKELLWVLKKNYCGEIQIKTINFTKATTQNFDFRLLDEKDTTAQLSLPLSYLYEPNAAILKSGAFKRIGHNFGLQKIHVNTHLYTSDNLINFPGRRFQIMEVLPYTKKNMRFLNIHQANISTRNFPESVLAIRKKFKIKDGGNHYLFFTTDLVNKRAVIICSKV